MAELAKYFMFHAITKLKETITESIVTYHNLFLFGMLQEVLDKEGSSCRDEDMEM